MTKTIYHLTDEKHLPAILKSGLTPQIGQNSSAIGDERYGIFCCDYEDVGYWSILINKHILLEITNIETDIDNTWTYSNYKEYCIKSPIHPFCIKLFDENVIHTDEQMKQLCESYLIAVSTFATKCARYYHDYDKTKEDQENLNYLASSITAVLPRLNYSICPMSYWEKCLTELGEDGEYTFCDTYNNTEKRLWQQLPAYGSDPIQNHRIKIHDFIEKNFPFAKTLCTGGWEDYSHTEPTTTIKSKED